MSATIDERIVEMKFDNREFETNASKTMSTLERLKAALKFDNATKDLGKIDSSLNNIDVSNIAAGVEALQNRFSTLGIVGMRVISNLTDSVMGFASKGINFLTSGILQGGYNRASNIENAKFQIQGLGYEWAQVEKQIDFAVNQTAYGLDSAAKAASTLLASGVEISDTFDASAGNLDQMGIALRAISGVAAQTNSDYDSIAHIFETVAGNGRLMGDQLNQLAYRGMNVAATLGEALGKSESDIRDLVSKGKISFQQFAQIMYDAFGEHAVKANETFTGSLSNVRAALARIGQAFYTPLIKQNGPLVQFFNALRLKINDIKAAITGEGSPIEYLSNTAIKVIEKVTKAVDELDVEGFFTVLDNLIKIVSNSLSVLKSILGPIGKAFLSVFPPVTAQRLGEITSKLSDLIKNMVLSESAQNGIYYISKAIFEVLKIGLTIISAVLKVVAKIVGFLGFIVEKGFEAVSFIVEFVRGMAAAVAESEAFQTVLGGIKYAIDFVRGAISAVIEAFKAFSSTLGDLPGVQMLLGALNELASFVKSNVVSALISFFDRIGSFFGSKGINIPKIEKFSELIDNIAAGIAVVVRKIPAAIRQVKKFVTSFGDLPIVQDVVSGIQNGFAKIGTFASPYIEKIKSTITSIWTSISATDISTLFSNFGSNIKNTLSKLRLTDIFSGVKKLVTQIGKPFSIFANNFKKFVANLKNSGNVIEAIKGGLSSLWGNISEKFSGFFETISNNSIVSWFIDHLGVIGEIGKTAAEGLGFLIEKIKELIFNLDVKQIVAFAFVLVLLNLMMNISDAVKKVGGAASGLTDFLGTIKKLFQVKSPSKSKMLQFAEAFAIIAAAVAGLTTVDQTKLKSSARVMIELMAVMGIVVAILEVISSIKTNHFASADMTGIGIAMVGFAGSMLILVAALKVMESVNMEGIQERLLVMATIAFTLVVIASLLSRGVSGKGALSIAATALFILAFSSVITSLSKMSNEADPDKLKKLVESLIPIMIGLGILAFGMGQIGVTSALGLLGVILILKMALPILDKIKDYDFSKIVAAIQKVIESTNLLTILVAAMVFVAVFSKNLKEFGSFLLMLSVSLLILVGVVKIISGMSTNDIEKGVGFIAACIGMFALLEILSSLTHWANFKDFGKGLILISISLLLLTGVVFLLGKINPATLQQGLVALGALVVMIALLELCSAATGKAKMGPLIVLFVGLAVIIAELVVLSMVPFSDLLGAVISLSIVLLALSKLITSLGKMGKVDITTIGVFITAVGLTIVIADALRDLATLPWTGLIAAAAALSITILAVAESVKIISELKGTNLNLGTIGTFALACVLLIVISDAIAPLAQYSWQNLLGAALSLSTVLLAVSVAISILSKISLAGGIKAAIALVSFFTVLGAAFAGLGYVIDLIGADTVKDKIKVFGDVLTAIGEGIGGFIGGIGSGIMDTIGPSLEKFGKNLSNFGESIQPFLESMKGIDSGVADGTKNMAAAVLELTKANFIDNLSNFFGLGHDLGQFGETIKTFGKHMVTFSDTVAGEIDDDAVEAAANAGMIMVELSREIPGSGGIIDKIMGNNDIDKWSSKLSVFAKAMVAFSNVVSADGAINKDAIQLAADCGAIMVELSKEIPNTGGVLGWLMGDNDIDKFGSMLPVFGKGIADFAKAITGKNIDQAATENAANCASILAALSKELPNTGGVIGFIMGNNDLGFFGDQLALFGDGIGKFSTSVAGVDVGVTQRGVNAARSVVNFFSEIEGVNLGTDLMPTQLVHGFDAIGEALVSYSDKMKSVDISQINKAANTVKELANLTSASAELPKIGSNIKALGNVSVDDFLKNFSNSSGKVSPAMSSFVKTCTDRLKSGKDKFKTEAQNMVTAFISGLGSKNSSITLAASNVAKQGKDSIRSYYTSFQEAGKYLVEGLISGINLKAPTAVTTIAKLSRNLIDTSKNILRQSSPSKVFIEIGRYIPEGLAIGVNRFADVAVKSVASFTEDVVDTGNLLETGINSVLSSDFNFDPTVRPVMDLTGIQNGIGLMNGMLDSQRSINLAANASMAYNQSKMQDTSMLTAINTAVDNALNKIYDKIEEASAKTPYQINVPLNLDKRTFARATATVTREELDRIDYFNNRKAGIA